MSGAGGPAAGTQAHASHASERRLLQGGGVRSTNVEQRGCRRRGWIDLLLQRGAHARQQGLGEALKLGSGCVLDLGGARLYPHAHSLLELFHGERYRQTGVARKRVTRVHRQETLTRQGL